MTSRYPYKVNDSIPAFATIGRRNADGWGIGYYHETRAIIKKSSEAAYDEKGLNKELTKLSLEAEGKIILGHIRKTSSGSVDECHSHPFVLDFLGREWIFIHSGTSRGIEKYRTARKKIKKTKSDSPRIFEFLRDRIMDIYEDKGHIEFNFFMALEEAIIDLLDSYQGGFNIMLTDGVLLYVFAHHRSLWLLHRAKMYGDATLMTTVDEGLTDEEWSSVGDFDSSYGVLMCFSDDLIISRSELAPGI